MLTRSCKKNKDSRIFKVVSRCCAPLCTVVSTVGGITQTQLCSYFFLMKHSHGLLCYLGDLSHSTCTAH